MDWIVVEGVKPWDGRYEFDAYFTTREWGWIKRLSGYLPLTIEDGWQGGDPELIAAFAVIALHRAGRIEARDAQTVFERIGDAPFGATVRLELDEAGESVEGDAGPPASSSSGKPPTSGDGSTTSSETSASRPNGSGTPASATSASAPARLAT